MTPDTYHNLEQFFDRYTSAFIDQADDPHPFVLKRTHTRRVCGHVEGLAAAIGTAGPDILMSKAAALLHDIGRFPQYEQYGTFSDRISENHAAMGVRVINEQNVLASCTPRTRKRIITAVSLHNAFALPDRLDPDTLKLARLIRDADKIDILRVMTAVYRDGGHGENRYITWNLDDDGRISPPLVATILNRKLINSDQVKSLNDFKLLQVSWLFDLNFEPSLKIMADLGYIPQILSTLPPSDDLTRLKEFVAACLSGHA